MAQLIQPLPDQIEDLSNAICASQQRFAIAQWCKQEGQYAQLEAWRQVLFGLLSATVEKLLGTNPDTLHTPESPLNKLMLQNAIEPGESSN